MYTIGILLILGSWFAVMTVLTQPEVVTLTSGTTFPAQCDIPSEAGRLFRQTWSKATPLPDTRYVWQVSGGEWEITAQELHQVGTQVGRNVAYETARDIGDGVIAGCMQFTSAISEVVPGGIVFRYQDAKNGYGVGFAKHNGQIVFAIGKSVRGTPRMLAAVTGYDPAEVHHVKIVLRGPRIQVYLDGDSTPILPASSLFTGSVAANGQVGANRSCTGRRLRVC